MDAPGFLGHRQDMRTAWKERFRMAMALPCPSHPPQGTMPRTVVMVSSHGSTRDPMGPEHRASLPPPGLAGEARAPRPTLTAAGGRSTHRAGTRRCSKDSSELDHKPFSRISTSSPRRRPVPPFTLPSAKVRPPCPAPRPGARAEASGRASFRPAGLGLGGAGPVCLCSWGGTSASGILSPTDRSRGCLAPCQLC